MLRVFPPILVLFVALVIIPGCRRQAPPSFSPGEEVLKLTDEIEDEEELTIYKELQSEIALLLDQYTGTPDNPIMLGEEESSTHLKVGYQLYSRYCMQCHGVNGDGNGPVAEYLNPKPRNYTLGIFKFTSTPYGSKPRRSDLIRTVHRGVTGTSMPSFDRFSDEQLGAVVDYVLVLTHRGELERELAAVAYEDEELPDEEGMADIVESILEPWEQSSNQLVMPETMMPPMTEESVRQGHQLFLKLACNKCHGKFGRGGSMGNVEVGVDAWGFKAAAADLSSGMLRGGGSPLDVYRRIHSGINGTPMPAFSQTFKDDPDAIWQIVHFIKQTGNRRRMGEPPLGEADLPVQEETAPTADESTEEADSEGESEPEESEETEPEEVEETSPAETSEEEEQEEESSAKESEESETSAEEETEPEAEGEEAEAAEEPVSEDTAAPAA